MRSSQVLDLARCRGEKRTDTRGTQNPVRATSCRFDSDLRHLLFQGLVRVLVQWSPHILMRGPFVDHSVSGSLYFLGSQRQWLQLTSASCKMVQSPIVSE